MGTLSTHARMSGQDTDWRFLEGCSTRHVWRRLDPRWTGLPDARCAGCSIILSAASPRRDTFQPAVRRCLLSTSLDCVSADPPWIPVPLQAGWPGKDLSGVGREMTSGVRPQVGSGKAALSSQVRGPDTIPRLESEKGGWGSRAVHPHQISSGPT